MQMENQRFFKDRKEAGERLGHLLLKLSILDPVIVALSEGGVIVGDEIAQLMKAPMDVTLAHKIGHPRFPNFSIGAIAEDEIPLFNPESVRHVSHNSEEMLDIISHQRKDLRERLKILRPGRSFMNIKNKSVIVVDEGMRTGVEAAAVGKFLASHVPKQLILAVPVGPVDISSIVEDQYDQVICLEHVRDLKNFENHYLEFDTVSDKDVVGVMERFHRRRELFI
jgi:putative phosphoribosyl transferase